MLNACDQLLAFNTIRVSNSLGPDQAPRFAGPNCLHRVPADGTSRQ